MFFHFKKVVKTLIPMFNINHQQSRHTIRTKEPMEEVMVQYGAIFFDQLCYYFTEMESHLNIKKEKNLFNH